MADNQYKRLANQGGNPRQVAEVVNRILDGGINSTGSITLQTSSTTTTVNDVLEYVISISCLPNGLFYICYKIVK